MLLLRHIRFHPFQVVCKTSLLKVHFRDPNQVLARAYLCTMFDRHLQNNRDNYLTSLYYQYENRLD